MNILDKPYGERTIYLKDADGDSNCCLESSIFKQGSKPMVDLVIYQGGPHAEKTTPWEMSVILDEESVLALRNHLNLLIEREKQMTDTEITVIGDNEKEPKYDFSTEEDILVFAEVVDCKLKVHITEILTPEGRHPGMASYANDYDNMLDYYIEGYTDVSNFTPNAFHIVEGFSGYFTKDYYYGDVDVEYDFKGIRLATHEEYEAYEGDYDNE